MTITVTVKIYMTLREKLGWNEKILVFDNEPTIRDILEKLPDLAQAIHEYEEKGYPPPIMVNGRRIEFTGGRETRLKNGDTITIFPPSAGG